MSVRTNVHRPWTREAAEVFLNMSGGLPGYEDIGAGQRAAAVALHRMLLDHGIAYLADEVGMGKTYVALATVALFRHLQPDFRVLYLAPSQNVLSKWHDRELPAFVFNNVRNADGRVRNADGSPAASHVECMNVDQWLTNAVRDGSTLDVFVPFSALSFQLTGDAPQWSERIRSLADLGNYRLNLTGVKKKDSYKDRAAEIVNDSLPYYDLVVIDEAHLLKGGTGAGAPDRAKFLARALGAVGTGGKRRFGMALLLSGTPFDRDLRQLARQFELFRRSDNHGEPHQVIRALADRRRQGETWRNVQAGLKPYLVRRVQTLNIDGSKLSRNQYRVEHRSEAAITLAGDMSAKALRQRLFMAVVQKRLIEHVEVEHGGRFPTAMFSSWEAYSVPRKAQLQRAQSQAASHAADDGAGDSEQGVYSLDIGKDEDTNNDTQAFDGLLMEDVVGSYREVFGTEPPHPKLESEAQRLAEEAFGAGLKQLVFVRRLKSVDDLHRRLNETYDQWLSRYLDGQGVPGCASDLRAKRQESISKLRLQDAPQASSSGSVADDRDAPLENDLPAHGDTLFTWFFRGKLDAAGHAFIDAYKLPDPHQLRERLRDPRQFESIIGELDWRGFLTDQWPCLPEVGIEDMARVASRIPLPATRLTRYRCLQAAWATLVVERMSGRYAQQTIHRMGALCAHLTALAKATDSHNGEPISADEARRLLATPTIALGLHQAGLGSVFLPQWQVVRRVLSVETADTAQPTESLTELCRRLASLDLQREVLYALLRLDHPFVDLYVAWSGGAHAKEGSDAAAALTERIVSVCQRDIGANCFGTASILGNLAEAWEQIEKTNFAGFLKGAKPLPRKLWRAEISALLLPFAPVEWASGQNTSSRKAVARRFRMPGYPMVLVSTSVLQEGEDLHVCCDRVTHFGISGSPIGIEQKNGRVDRIGSRAQRHLLKGNSVQDAGIHVRFPHLSESLEWFQIRDLSLHINEYLHSMHEIGNHSESGDIRLTETMANGGPIPPLIRDRLHSPFEPD